MKIKYSAFIKIQISVESVLHLLCWRQIIQANIKPEQKLETYFIQRKKLKQGVVIIVKPIILRLLA